MFKFRKPKLYIMDNEMSPDLKRALNSKEISYQLDGPLPIGTHSIQFTARDRAGNEVSRNIEFTVY